MIAPFIVNLIILGIIILFIAGVGALDRQRRNRTSEPGKLIRLLEAAVSLILAEVFLIPAYVLLLIGIAFNDTGYTTSSFVEFFSSVIPVYFIYVYAISAGVIAFLMRKRAKAHIVTLTIFILVHVAISVFLVFMYMDVYMTHDINVKYNPITIQRGKERLEEKQAIAKQQEQEYQDYMAKKASYEIIFEKDLDDVQYKITKNNDVFYFEYKNKKNNDAFAKELTISDDLAEITPRQQESLDGSDKYEIYFNSYLPAENHPKLLHYISIPSLGFYYEFDEYQYAYKDKYNMIIINNGQTSFNKFIHGLFYPPAQVEPY